MFAFQGLEKGTEMKDPFITPHGDFSLIYSYATWRGAQKRLSTSPISTTTVFSWE